MNLLCLQCVFRSHYVENCPVILFAILNNNGRKGPSPAIVPILCKQLQKIYFTSRLLTSNSLLNTYFHEAINEIIYIKICILRKLTDLLELNLEPFNGRSENK